MLPLSPFILLWYVHGTQRVKQDGQSMILAKALVPCCLSMLSGLLFPLHTNVTNSTAQREVGDVCELPSLMALQMTNSL